MARILVGTYRSRRDADDARRKLLEDGFDDTRIRVEGPGIDDSSGPETAADGAPSTASEKELRGISGVIARMFSDLLPDDADRERYERALQSGSALVAVHGLDETSAARAKPILERGGTVDEHSHASSVPAERPDDLVERSAGLGAAAARGRGGPDTSTRAGPDVTPLPNAPTGWNEAVDGSRAATGRGMQDPGRPEGIMRGANRLGVNEDRERLGREDGKGSR